jgi:hypothetical protein
MGRIDYGLEMLDQIERYASIYLKITFSFFAYYIYDGRG